ncbi:GNAT family N-acetyltransferase [Sphingobacterium faecale]|uniref:GNAT family N-acetyltransferase n=1 Tax=Sphingobacterium faecale TaxID=2803775 RepID=A0ABS1R3S0_9SPHI|nr:GNAT family protein [Sphingobacterium faecale]MBL1409356.1 GNAT family N-acetyltransferase [Sphingobacterium faecale]
MQHKTPNQPVETISLCEDICLVPSCEEHATALFDAIDTNRAFLSRFLPWVDHTQALSDTVSYLQYAIANNAKGNELTYNIFRNNTLIGRIGIHQIDRTNDNASIGYWLVEKEQGNGIITKATEMILKIAFKDLGFQRIEILTATKNKRSSAIPLRLGFVHEGVLRQMEKHGNTYFDLNIFSLLKQEWKKQKRNIMG